MRGDNLDRIWTKDGSKLRPEIDRVNFKEGEWWAREKNKGGLERSRDGKVEAHKLYRRCSNGRLAAYVKQSRYVKEASRPSGVPWRGHGSDNRRAAPRRTGEAKGRRE